ncbi:MULTISPECIES: FHA domain-containing protein [Cellulosimicrobium]|uniref:FHA domain-containing protein n=1 Tax=Cellulosimicrobium TaxID=157920 RepID=UPI000A32274F|nr:FHA domain-containing protein [Cellulosimicrobium sp. KWT-B]
MTLRYVTGTARTVVRGGAVVVLPAPVEPALVEQVWDQLGTDAGVVEVLQVLTGAFGSSLRTVPPFVVAVVTGRRVHVAARGRLSVTLELDGGERVQVEGEGVTTWSERVLDDVVELLVQADAGVVPVEPAPPGGPLLGDALSVPLESGVVLASAVAWPLVERPEQPVASGGEDLGSDPGPDDDRLVTSEASAPEDRASQPGPGARHAAAETATLAEAPAVPSATTVLGGLGATLRLPEETIAPQPDAVEPPPVVEPAAPVSEAPPEEDDDYAHLWGSTILRTVEDAAVRSAEDDETDEADEPAPSATVPPAPPVPAVPAPPADEAPVPAPPPAPDGLIAGVPREWTGATPAAAHRAATVTPDDEPAPVAGLDHDGHTVLSSAIADLRAAAQEPAVEDAPVPPPVPSFSPPPAPGQQQILARTCPEGHANPPSRDTCAVCDAPLDGDAELAVRPPLGRVVVSTGQTLELDRPVVVGRRPRSPRTQAAELPRLVTVPSPQQDISRSHLEITLEGWHVLVSDMATTNGTTLLRGGQPPRRLHPSEPVLVVDGDVADLGDGVTLRFEGIR